MMYFGILFVMLRYVGAHELVHAFFDVPQIRSIILKMAGLGALYMLFGVTVLRYNATHTQRLLLLSGPTLIAIAFFVQLAWFIVHPAAPSGMRDLLAQGYSLRTMMAAIPLFLAVWVWLFVRKREFSVQPNQWLNR
ncbi:MAG: hypothetical protein ABWY06_13510 [Pseudomonas sp.]|uniref:hypothetical protein n=1 Tax=Pseudomonas sp. TaxID=306 RepID=UPI00339456CA